MADADSEQSVSFGEIFTGQKSAPSNDFESSLLDYSQPTYTANFQNYVDAVLQPAIQCYNSGSQLMRWDIGGYPNHDNHDNTYHFTYIPLNIQYIIINIPQVLTIPCSPIYPP